MLKQIAARLPIRLQAEMKRIDYGWRIRRNAFTTDEPENKILPELVQCDDWVIDIGANVGRYTKRLSELVGARGRVIAFEPVPTTFSLLASNAQLFAHPNVTLINAAVSDRLGVVGMSIPKASTGLANYELAHLSSAIDNAFAVLTLSIDSLCIGQRIALVKIDAEGHENFALKGMKQLLTTYHPILIVETRAEEVITYLDALGYWPTRLENSPNILFKPTHIETEV